MTDINLVDIEINPKDFEPVLYDNLPKLFVGVKLKHQFDKETFCRRKNALNVVHICALNGVEKAVYLNGTFKQPSELTLRLYDFIRGITNIDWGTIYSDYKAALRIHNLSCETSFSHLMDGMYPIDSIHYKEVIDDETTLESEVYALMEELNIPWYLMPDIKIFILGKCNAFMQYNM
jgi:hypothetical protein